MRELLIAGSSGFMETRLRLELRLKGFLEFSRTQGRGHDKPGDKGSGFPDGSDGKESACNAGDPGSIPGLGRFLGEGNGNPLQYSCL